MILAIFDLQVIPILPIKLSQWAFYSEMKFKMDGWMDILFIDAQP